MKTLKTPYKTLLLAAMLLLSAGALKAQSRADSAVNSIATKLSVSKEKAQQIYAANTYKQDEVERLINDKNRKPGDKQGMLMRLMAERRHKVDSVMTPAQKEAMHRDDAAIKQQIAAKSQEIMKRHDAEMNSVPHQRVAKAATDSTKKKTGAK